MLIRSYLKEPNLLFYDLNLESHLKKELFQTQTVDFRKEGFNVKGQLSFNSDVCIVHSEINNDQRLTDVVEVRGEYIKIVYLVKDNPMIDRSQGNKCLNYPGFTISYGKNTVNQFEMPSNNSTELILVYLTRSYFVSLLQKEEWSSRDPFFRKVTDDKNPGTWEKSFPVDLALCNICREIKQCCLCPCPMRKSCYFAGLKIREFFLELSHFNQRDQDAIDLHPDILTKINAARKFINANFEHTPTVKYLARHVILNELQLKEGFRKVYGTTIRAYIIELKMQKSLSLLHYHQINEITTMLGYQSVSHFITTFKKFYGCTPTRMMKSSFRIAGKAKPANKRFV